MPVERTTASRILGMRAFQEWMVAVRILEQSAESEDQNDDYPEMVRPVLEQLHSNRGFIVPYDQLVAKKRKKGWASAISEVRRDNTNLPAVLNARHMGMATGVEKFHLLSPQSLGMVYLGWWGFGRLIPVRTHSDFLYGSHDVSDLRATNHVMQRLQKRDLPNSTVSLDHIYLEGDDYIRLVDIHLLLAKYQKDKVEPDPDNPPHLHHKYQDWLVNNSKLAERSIDPKWKIDPAILLKDSATVSEPTGRVLSELCTNVGYIVDKRRLTAIALGEEGSLDDDWNSQMLAIAREINEAMSHDLSVSQFKNIGWSLGMEKLKLSPLALKALFTLWQRINIPVQYQTLANELYGSKSRKSQDKAGLVINRLNAELRTSPIVVGSVYDFNTKKQSRSPILIYRNSIIRD